MRSLELALLVSSAFHDRLSDPIGKAEVLVTVGLPSGPDRAFTCSTPPAANAFCSRSSAEFSVASSFA